MVVKVIAHLCWGEGNCTTLSKGGEGIFIFFKKFRHFFLGHTDRQTDIVVHREVKLPKISLA